MSYVYSPILPPGFGCRSMMLHWTEAYTDMTSMGVANLHEQILLSPSIIRLHLMASSYHSSLYLIDFLSTPNNLIFQIQYTCYRNFNAFYFQLFFLKKKKSLSLNISLTLLLSGTAYPIN